MKLSKIFKKVINENELIEDYPTSFDREFFKTLTSFNARIKYCEENLQRISSGSSRIVYKIDDEKCLKLAKNKKGLTQNEVESDFSRDWYINHLFAEVYDTHKNYLWIEMQLAKKVSKSDFKKYLDLDFDDFCMMIDIFGSENTSSVYRPENIDELYENEMVQAMNDFIVNYEVPIGDLKRLSSYGIVNDDIVLVDYGLDKDAYITHYKK